MSDFKVTPLDKDTDFDNLPFWDVVIIGAGPAGLAAGLTTAHRGLTTLVIEAKGEPGGQPQFLYAEKKIIDIPGFPDGITGEELSERTFRQAREALVQFRFQEELTDIEETTETGKDEPLKRVVTTKGSYLCRKVILACGLLHYPRKLPVLDALESNRVHYKVPRVNDYHGENVVVVGGGDSALDAAVMALQRGAQVQVFVRKEHPAGKAKSVERIQELGGEILGNTEIASARLDGGRIVLQTNSGREIVTDHVIVQIGFLSAKETFQRLNVALSDDGSISIDPYYETSRKGIFAVGDVHGDIKLIVVAWAEGIQAAIYAFKEITSPYWLNERRLHDHKLALIGEKVSRAAAEVHRPN
ncbi:MAG: NAD(P)/FAD-dependent oxidoreductase [Planctomycetaceae bacterium]